MASPEEDFQREVLRRLDMIEQFMDQAKGALTLAKFVLSFVGLGGLATFLVVLGQSSR